MIAENWHSDQMMETLKDDWFGFDPEKVDNVS